MALSLPTAAAPRPFAPFNLAELECFKQAAANMEHMGRCARASLAELAAERDVKLDRYKADLASFDWSFEQADDARAYRDGVEALRSLHAMQAEVDPNGALWLEAIAGKWGAAGPRVGVFA